MAEGWWLPGSEERRALDRRTLYDQRPSVSVIVPAFNEAAVVPNCVRSILASRYARLEVVLVDDGSTDETLAQLKELARTDRRVKVLTQANAGKGSALNKGITSSTGEVLMFVDADGIFCPNTIEEMLEGFIDDSVGAVCGDDRPVNIDRVQTRLLTIISHVGTGLVRRVLTVLRCLPIVSGNIGAFRRQMIEEIGGFREDTVGEDLELTWRVHRAGYQVRFQPRALVMAESPSTIRGLWKQRVRWARGLLQTLKIHADMVGNVRFGIFGLYLLLNTLTMVVVPLAQLAVLVLLPVGLWLGRDVLPSSLLAVVGFLGLLISLALILLALSFNKALRDLRHIWTLFCWPFYSVFVGLTMVAAPYLEATGQPAKWNKLQRTGVIDAVRAESLAELKVIR